MKHILFAVLATGLVGLLIRLAYSLSPHERKRVVKGVAKAVLALVLAALLVVFVFQLNYF